MREKRMTLGGARGVSIGEIEKWENENEGLKTLYSGREAMQVSRLAPITSPPLTTQTSAHHTNTMGNLKKKRRLKMSKHKRRKRLKANRHKKRTWQK
jgi:hypothetical protein